MPFVRQALLTAEADLLADAIRFLEEAARAAAGINAPEVLVYDPVPMPLVRLMNRERGQLLVESPDRRALHRFLALWSRSLQEIRAPSKLAWTLEVDPLET